MKTMKLIFLPLLMVMASTILSCESDNEEIQQSNLESSQSSELTRSVRNNPTRFATVVSGEEATIPVGWGDEEVPSLIIQPKNAATSQLTAPFHYVYQSEEGFVGTEIVMVQSFEPEAIFSSTITFTTVVITVVEPEEEEIPTVGIRF